VRGTFSHRRGPRSGADKCCGERTSFARRMSHAVFLHIFSSARARLCRFFFAAVFRPPRRTRPPNPPPCGTIGADAEPVRGLRRPASRLPRRQRPPGAEGGYRRLRCRRQHQARPGGPSRSAVYPYLGPQRTRDDVENARSAPRTRLSAEGVTSPSSWKFPRRR